VIVNVTVNDVVNEYVSVDLRSSADYIIILGIIDTYVLCI